MSAVIDGILPVWFLQEEQRTLVVVTPLELRQGGRDRIQFQGWDVAVPPITWCCRQVNQPLLNLCKQCCFPHPRWANDKNERRSRWLTQGVPDRLVSLFQGWMSDGKRLEVVQSTLGWVLEQMMEERHRFWHYRYSP